MPYLEEPGARNQIVSETNAARIAQPPGRMAQLGRAIWLGMLALIGGFWWIGRWILFIPLAVLADAAQAEIQQIMHAGKPAPIASHDTIVLQYTNISLSLLVGVAAALVVVVLLGRFAWRRFRAIRAETRRCRSGLASIRASTPLYTLSPVRQVMPGNDLGLWLAPVIYARRTADATLRQVLARPARPARTEASPLWGAVVIGPAASGKTRLLVELLRDIPQYLLMRWPSQLEDPPALDLTLLRGQYVAVWLDDLTRYANEADADLLTLLPRRLVAAGAYPLVLATCRDGADEAVVRHYLHPLLSVLAEVRLGANETVPSGSEVPESVALSSPAQLVVDWTRQLITWGVRTFPEALLQCATSPATGGAVPDWATVRTELVDQGLFSGATGVGGMLPSSLVRADPVPLASLEQVQRDRNTLTALLEHVTPTPQWGVIWAALLAQRGGRSGARDHLETTAPSSPHLAQNASLLGALFLEVSEWDQARAALDRALEVFPDAPWVLLRRATLALRRNDSAQAEQDIKTLLRAWPRDDVMQTLLAAVYQQTGQPGEAIAYLKRARKDDPESAALLIEEATLALHQERLVEASELAQLAAGSSRADIEMVDRAGDLLSQCGEAALPQARHAFEHALANSFGADGRACLGLARLALRAKPSRTDQAEAMLRWGVALGGTTEAAARGELAKVLATTHRAGEAETELRLATGLAPDSPDLQQALGQLLLARGQPIEAEPYARTVASARPDNAEALALLGTVLLRKGQADWTEADQVLTRAVAQDNPPATSARASLGELSLRLGRLDQAAELLRQALRQPDHDDCRMLLAQGLALQGERAAAIQVLRAMPSADPQQLLLGILALQEGDDAEAGRLFMAIHTSPEDRLSAMVYLSALDLAAHDAVSAQARIAQAEQEAHTLQATQPFPVPLVTALDLVLARVIAGHVDEALARARDVFTAARQFDALDRLAIQRYGPLLERLQNQRHITPAIGELILVLDSAAESIGAR